LNMSGRLNGAADGAGPLGAANVAGAILLHLDAANNLARWLIGDEHDAQDLVQEACLRAVRSAATYRGGDVRSWLLAIVRNACFDAMKRSKILRISALGEESEVADSAADADPATILQRADDVRLIREAIASLEPEFREVIVLREMEGLSYKDIAQVTDIPMGTVMSRLARARRQLASLLSRKENPTPGKPEERV
jgi:RNA polymerase sigma factor (sigma-70 family)